MVSAEVLALASADRQALVPMAVGYLILMSALGFGLRRLYRPRGDPSGADAWPDGTRTTPPGPGQRTGWAALVRKVAGTVVGGYLLLMAVVVAYYFGVARVGPGFLESAVTARRCCWDSRRRYSPRCPGWPSAASATSMRTAPTPAAARSSSCQAASNRTGRFGGERPR